jgi:hypothetical protein
LADHRIGQIPSKSFSVRRELLLTLVLLGLGLLAVILGGGAAIRAAQLEFVYPPELDVAFSRHFEPVDWGDVPPGGVITVTVLITNLEQTAVRGFYYSDQIPNGWPVQTAAVLVDGVPLADYFHGVGVSDQIYEGFTPHRWALELPQGGGVFSPTHPIPAAGGAAHVIYAIEVSGGMGSDYLAGQEGWAGWLAGEPTGVGIFGYEGPGHAPSPTPSPTATGSPTPSATPTASPTASPTATGSPTPSATPTASPTASSTATPTLTPSATATPSLTPTATMVAPSDQYTVYLPLLVRCTAP